jgi:hypothetical protein
VGRRRRAEKGLAFSPFGVWAVVCWWARARRKARLIEGHVTHVPAILWRQNGSVGIDLVLLCCHAFYSVLLT